MGVAGDPEKYWQGWQWDGKPGADRDNCPDIWNRGLITPIFKNGNKSDPDNYRGICVNSNLIDFFMKHNVLRKIQIGFIQNLSLSVCFLVMFWCVTCFTSVSVLFLPMSGFPPV